MGEKNAKVAKSDLRLSSKVKITPETSHILMSDHPGIENWALTRACAKKHWLS